MLIPLLIVFSKLQPTVRSGLGVASEKGHPTVDRFLFFIPPCELNLIPALHNREKGEDGEVVGHYTYFLIVVISDQGSDEGAEAINHVGDVFALGEAVVVLARKSDVTLLLLELLAVELIVHVFKPLICDVSVDLGGSDGGVTQQSLDTPNVRPVQQKIGGKRVAQGMWGDMLN